ncbi:hypothetical protein [Microcoleus anatoxicus]|uniref:hypothetical protein n=1 Tax=Microcoleus anatoxicus TaxID=2705319 RepID=UPI0030C8F8B6
MTTFYPTGSNSASDSSEISSQLNTGSFDIPMGIQEFIRRLEAEIHNAATNSTPNISLTSHAHTQDNVVYLSSNGNTDDYIPDTAPIPEQNYVQKTVEALYSGAPWASIAGQLFEFTGTHYELRLEVTEKRRILEWLNTYSELVKGKLSLQPCQLCQRQRGL